MKAALMERGRIWVDTVPDPEPQAGEILVKSVACGVCGSDLHALKHTEEFVATSRENGGAFRLTTLNPVVLGHEFCAEVVEYGPDTKRDVAIGELVCAIPALPRAGEFEPVGYSENVPGGFAEYMVLSERLSVPVPAGTPRQLAALTEPMAVGYHAVNKARLSGDESLLVIGAGPVGLAVVACLKQRGAGPVTVAEFSPVRRKLAELMGADVVVDPRQLSPYAHKEVSAAENVTIFECVGVRGMIGGIFQDAPQNAQIVVVGVCLQEDVSRPLIAINKELSVQYVLGYSFREFKTTLGLIADGTLNVEPIITSEVSLDEVATAFEDLGQPDQQGKVLVTPWG
jgi:2-desacetyl-2-hydroxyethyl bacteriochlorophyllide A dehydrogenase